MTLQERLLALRVVGWVLFGVGLLFGAVGLAVWAVAVIQQLPPVKSMDDISYLPTVTSISFLVIGLISFIIGLVLVVKSYRKNRRFQPPDEPGEG